MAVPRRRALPTVTSPFPSPTATSPFPSSLCPSGRPAAGVDPPIWKTGGRRCGSDLVAHELDMWRSLRFGGVWVRFGCGICLSPLRSNRSPSIPPPLLLLSALSSSSAAACWSQPLSFLADLFATCWSDSPKNPGVGLRNYFLALSVDQLSTKWFNCFWSSILQFGDLQAAAASPSSALLCYLLVKPADHIEASTSKRR